MDSRPGNVLCDICRRGIHPQRLPFLCAVDARNALYEGRFANASVMIEMDDLEQQVSALLNKSNTNAPSADTSRKIFLENCVSEERKTKHRTDQIIAAAEKLQKEVDDARKQIEERKAVIMRRKADLSAASQGIAARRSREIDEAKTAIRKIKYHWDREHEATAQYRAALCTEVAKLYRLQRIRRGNPNRYEYRIGGSEVVDLQHINSESYNISVRLPCG